MAGPYAYARPWTPKRSTVPSGDGCVPLERGSVSSLRARGDPALSRCEWTPLSWLGWLGGSEGIAVRVPSKTVVGWRWSMKRPPRPAGGRGGRGEEWSVPLGEVLMLQVGVEARGWACSSLAFFAAAVLGDPSEGARPPSRTWPDPGRPGPDRTRGRFGRGSARGARRTRAGTRRTNGGPHAFGRGFGEVRTACAVGAEVPGDSEGPVKPRGGLRAGGGFV